MATRRAQLFFHAYFEQSPPSLLDLMVLPDAQQLLHYHFYIGPKKAPARLENQRVKIWSVPLDPEYQPAAMERKEYEMKPFFHIGKIQYAVFHRGSAMRRFAYPKGPDLDSVPSPEADFSSNTCGQGSKLEAEIRKHVKDQGVRSIRSSDGIRPLGQKQLTTAGLAEGVDHATDAWFDGMERAAQAGLEKMRKRREPKG